MAEVPLIASNFPMESTFVLTCSCCVKLSSLLLVEYETRLLSRTVCVFR